MKRDVEATVHEALTDIAKAEAEDRDEDPLRFVARLKADDRWDDYRSAKENERAFRALRNAATIKEEES